MLQEGFRYKPELHREYLRSKLALEARLQDPLFGQEIDQTYQTDRIRLAYVVKPELRKKLRLSQDRIQVLEVGGGVGAAMAILLDFFSEEQRIDFTMTSLIRHQRHQGLKERGVRVYTGVLIEHLPKHWTERFDIVCTDAVLGWSDMKAGISEVKRVLKHGGIWIGTEPYSGYAPSERKDMRLAVPAAMRALGMRNINDQGDLTRNIDPWGGTVCVKYVKS